MYKFRALKDDVSNCNFVYGSLVVTPDGTPRIMNDVGGLFHTCLKNTESLFSGFHDKNGNEIYAGDIVEAPLGRFLIEFKKSAFIRRSIFINVEGKKVTNILDPVHTLYSTEGFESVEIVGNIYQNENLLNL